MPYMYCFECYKQHFKVDSQPNRQPMQLVSPGLIPIKCPVLETGLADTFCTTPFAVH